MTMLPVIQRPLDNTALQAYMACPREYYFSMFLHRRAKGSSPALVYGTAWHKALEVHYKSGGNGDLVELMVRASWEGHDAVDDYRTLDRVLLDYRRYRKEFGTPEDEARAGKGRTLGYPDEPMVELSLNAQAEPLIHPWAGKIDRLIELGGLCYVEDHKTTSRLDRNYYRGFELSQQMMGYTLLAQQLMPSRQVVGVRINVAHVLKTGTKFERQLFTYSPAQLDEWARNTNEWMHRLSCDIYRWENKRKEGTEGYDPSYWPLAHYGDNGCSRKYGTCVYHQVCSVSPRLRQGMLESQFDVNPWNPLAVEED